MAERVRRRRAGLAAAACTLLALLAPLALLAAIGAAGWRVGDAFAFHGGVVARGEVGGARGALAGAAVAEQVELRGRGGGGRIDKVFLVYSSHFDLGYTLNRNGSCAAAVLEQYFFEHFPKAIATGREARAQGRFRYQWLTQSWIVAAFIFCDEVRAGLPSLQCPGPEQVAQVGDAIREGVIVWHAFPFNAEPELFEAALFEAALKLTERLDAAFGVPGKRTMSQRDVPGFTRAAIPLLAKHNVRAVSVGQNQQCAPVNVPPVFMWKDVSSGEQVLALFHSGGYGRRRRRRLSPEDDDRDENEGGTITRQSDDHCVQVPAARAALCFAWRQDNRGPHALWEAGLALDLVQARFPHATVATTNSFDRFAEVALEVRDSLPVVTSEIGDTWIYGASSDPLKMALFRSAARLYAECLAEGGAAACLQPQPRPQPQAEGRPSDAGTTSSPQLPPVPPTQQRLAQLHAFERLLMTGGEHTWGFDGGKVKFAAWANADLQRALATDKAFNDTVLTWVEHRGMVQGALAALPSDSKLARDVRAEWQDISGYRGSRFSSAGFTTVAQPLAERQCGAFTLRLAPDGSIASFRRTPATGSHASVDWASGNRRLMRLFYHNLDAQDYERFADDYIYGFSRLWIDGLSENLIKPNLRIPAINSTVSLHRLSASADGRTLLLDMRNEVAAAHADRGAPASYQAKISCGLGNQVHYDLRWFDKTPTKGPETVWLLNDLRPRSRRVLLGKLASQVDAADADLGGCSGHVLTCGVHLHAVTQGVTTLAAPGHGALRIQSLDSSLVSLSPALSPLPTPLRKPDIERGAVHFPLVGNLWNTNYPLFYPFVPKDTSSQFRFVFTLLEDENGNENEPENEQN